MTCVVRVYFPLLVAMAIAIVVPLAPALAADTAASNAVVDVAKFVRSSTSNQDSRSGIWTVLGGESSHGLRRKRKSANPSSLASKSEEQPSSSTFQLFGGTFMDTVFGALTDRPSSVEDDEQVRKVEEESTPVSEFQRNLEMLDETYDRDDVYYYFTALMEQDDLAGSLLAPTLSPAPTQPPVPTVSPAPTKGKVSLEPSREVATNPSPTPFSTTAPFVGSGSLPTKDPSSMIEPSVNSTSTPTMNPSNSPSSSIQPTEVNCTDPNVRAAILLSLLSQVSSTTSLEDPSSPEGQAANWVTSEDDLRVNPCEDPTTLFNRYGLAVLYFSLGGVSWKSSSGWLTGDDECSWEGIACDEEGSITTINLEANNAVGSLPPEISIFVKLNRLLLFANAVTGSLPTTISELSQLKTLDVELNNMTGALFDEHLLNLSSLVNLRASFNDFTGTIADVSSLQGLQEFWIAGNNFVGSIPETISQLVDLESIFLYSNSLTGSISSSFGSLPKLEWIDFSNNFLRGAIPEELYNVLTMERILLNGNSLTGTISTQLGNLVNLEDLWLNNNLLSGSIPDEIGKLVKLQELFLNDNDLTGVIPSTIANVTGLKFVDISNNGIGGTIPPDLFLLENITNVYLFNNSLVGTLPREIVEADNLNDLYVNGNVLTGNVPEVPEGKLGNLEELLLHENELVGTIPDSICALREGNLQALWADCTIPPDPPQIFSDCATKCFPFTGQDI